MKMAPLNFLLLAGREKMDSSADICRPFIPEKRGEGGDRNPLIPFPKYRS
jgi:hypothetical protein